MTDVGYETELEQIIDTEVSKALDTGLKDDDEKLEITKGDNSPAGHPHSDSKLIYLHLSPDHSHQD